jgi:hypothetical protein
MKSHWKLLALPISFLSDAASAESFRSHSTDNEWNSTAISASGGIGTLSANFVDHFFTDPSKIALNQRSFILQFLGLSVNYTKDLIDTAGEVQDLSNKSSSGGSDTESAIKVINQFRKVFGRRLAGGLNVNLLSLKMGGVSLIPYASVTFDGEARIPDWPETKAVGDIYGGLGIGYARVFGTQWDAGMNVRPGYRLYANGAVGMDSIASEFSKDTTTTTTTTDESVKFGTYGSGFYIPLDMGVGYRPHPLMRFTFVIRDFAGAPPLTTDGTANPPVYPMRLNLGGSGTALEKGNHKISVATELQDLANIASGGSAFLFRWQSAAQYGYKLAFRQDPTFQLNLGMQSGYPSAGILLDLFVAKLEAATYTKEAGYYIGQRPERKYSFKLWTQLAF